MERAIGIITTNYSTQNPSHLTVARPVAAMPIAGRYRMVDFMLSCMVNSDMRTVGVIMPYKYRSIVDHLASGKDWNLDRKHGGLFLLPGSSYGSTQAGGRFIIRDLENNISYLEKADQPYVILAAASIIMNVNLHELVDAHIASDADITVACKTATVDNNALMKFELSDGCVSAVSMGVSVGETASLDCCIMSVGMLLQLLKWYEAIDYLDLFEALTTDLNRVCVKPFYYDVPSMSILSLQDYYQNSMKFLNPDITSKIFVEDRPIRTKAHDLPPAKYEPGATVSHSLISGGCRISGHVQDSILFRSVIVEPGASIKSSIIMQNCVIEAGAQLENAVIDRDNVIYKGTEMRGTLEDILVKRKGSRR